MKFQLHPDLARDGILVGRFELCLVLLINDSAYPWFVLVPQRNNIRDPIDLTHDDYQLLSEESRALGIAVMKSFQGEKLNIAALGNMTPQLHVHHIVRYANDPAWPAPIWGKQPMQPYEESSITEIRKRLSKAKMSGFVSA